MKNVIKTTVAAIALTAVIAGPASAMVSKSELNHDVLSKLDAGSYINVIERNGVVTLTGYYSDIGDKTAAIRAAEQAEGVNKVINLAFTHK